MLKSKHIIFVLAISFIAVIFFYQNTSRLGIVQNQFTQKSKQNKALPDTGEKVDIPKKLKPVKQKYNTFDSNPKINIALYKAKFGGCISIKLIEEQKQKGHLLMDWTEKQKQYISEIKKKCDDTNKKYPELAALDTNLLPKKAIGKPENILVNYLENKNINTEAETFEYLKLIGKDYPDLIPLSNTKITKYYYETIIPDFKKIIQTENRAYASRIASLTKNFMACQQGANCDAQSEIMFPYCILNEHFCVNDFMELYNTRFSDGVKADILLTLPYLKRLYQID